MADTLPGTPYVESSDLVSNYPAVSEDLAERVDLVGILPFADSTARTTALPTPTDGQYSYLQDTNSTEFYNGVAWVAAGGGKILQVVSTIKTDTFTTASSSPVDVTGLSLSITPASATSKVFVITNCVISNTNQFRAAFIQIVRNSTAISIGDAASNRARASGGSEVADGYFSLGFTPLILDSPNTTSAITYKVQLWRATDGTAVINRTGADNDTAQRGRFASSITAFEVSA